jgi:predicted nuclease with TOPRIM domain
MQAKIIKNVSRDYEELKKLLSDKVNERDILGTQLIRRNDELALLYEKIKILQSTLSKGEI